ncbi:MAG TPA: hypothetical protein PLD43_11175 [Anaerolineae bacterium]|nr:hypothetical protein [Anaerolineae bacterium]HXK42854.1 hypothetical protein [Anaerolineae bacterium]
MQAFKVRRRECRRKPPVKRDGDAAGRQVRRGNASPAQRGQPKAGQRLLQPHLDLRTRQAQVLQAEDHLVFDRRRQQLRRRILEHHPRTLGELP